MINDITQDAERRMKKAVETVQHELVKIRTGRAHPTLLDHVMVDYYGSPTPIKQVANVVAEDSRTLMITPYEKPMVSAIEKAIQNSDLGLNPSSAGTVIRVPMPALTEQRRKDLVKVVKHEGENARVAIRNIRRDANTHIKELLKEKDVSEDDARRGEDAIQKLTDKYIANVDKALEAKEKEMMEV
ncbi:MAG TPA: ribosome recycling factor [Gammaproteobacteria bacterium]|jgi:ribosome recycling factor|nr:ribosome recycling factor [Gammaproteobacteria bacterium]